ncbi:hypothetical protein LZ30DRAFT_702033 [Colletotrichum cereale]|nr:hypothetical protein LZ30DRAFT_702033 [Colletotrichum cereale]
MTLKVFLDGADISSRITSDEVLSDGTSLIAFLAARILSLARRNLSEVLALMILMVYRLVWNPWWLWTSVPAMLLLLFPDAFMSRGETCFAEK